MARKRKVGRPKGSKNRKAKAAVVATKYSGFPKKVGKLVSKFAGWVYPARTGKVFGVGPVKGNCSIQVVGGITLLTCRGYRFGGGDVPSHNQICEVMWPLSSIARINKSDKAEWVK